MHGDYPPRQCVQQHRHRRHLKRGGYVQGGHDADLQEGGVQVAAYHSRSDERAALQEGPGQVGKAPVQHAERMGEGRCERVRVYR